MESQKQLAIEQHSIQADQFAERYEGGDPYASCFPYSRKRLDLLLARYIPARGDGLKMLDVGCGTGSHVARYRARGFDVAGVDGSEEMLEHARALNPGADLRQADVDALPFPDASFDIVLCVEVHRYLPDATKAVSEMARVLKPGALLLLKGPNGVGKTTLIKALAGLAPPETGNILWKDEPIKDSVTFKRDLMYIGHKSAVKLDSTVEENLAFWARLYDTEILVPAALKFYDLTKFKDVPASQLSAGWQRRVALARLIVAPCNLWLLDEPTNFLDDEAVMLTASLIESRVMQGGIVVVASHIMNSAIAAHTLYLGDFCLN